MPSSQQLQSLEISLRGFLLTSVLFLNTVLSGASWFPLGGNTIHWRNILRQRILNFSAESARSRTRIRTVHLLRQTQLVAECLPSMLLGSGVSRPVVCPAPPPHQTLGHPEGTRVDPLVLFLVENHLPCQGSWENALPVPLQSWSLELFEKGSFLTPGWKCTIRKVRIELLDGTVYSLLFR